jgi:hypothetical protein
MFELWSQKIGGPGTSAYHRETLTGIMTGPKPLTYEERTAAESAFCGCPPNADWTDSALETYTGLSAVMTAHRTTVLNPASKVLR